MQKTIQQIEINELSSVWCKKFTVLILRKFLECLVKGAGNDNDDDRSEFC
jgi:hypothetical protein